MEILYKNEHLSCISYDNSEKPDIEVIKVLKGNKWKLSFTGNEIVCIIEGRVRYSYPGSPFYEGSKGMMIFHRIKTDYNLESLADTIVVVLRIAQPIELCQSYPLEKLCKIREDEVNNKNKAEWRPPGTLGINPRMWYFLDGVIDCISDGIKCRHWFDIKIKEFFIILRGYYPKEDLHGFFYSILSKDIAFSEYMRLNWQDFRSVNQMSALMNLSPKQFTSRFMSVFGQTPYQWIMERKARIAYKTIISTKLAFKQIAMDNGFNSDTQFTRFCKEKFGKTPTELRNESLQHKSE